MSTAVKSVELLAPATIATTGAAYAGPWNDARRAMVQATIDGTGAVSATVVVQGSNNGKHWTQIGSMSLSGTDTDAKTLAVDYPWAHIRAVSSALSGTGATVAARMSL